MTTKITIFTNGSDNAVQLLVSTLRADEYDVIRPSSRDDIDPDCVEGETVALWRNGPLNSEVNYSDFHSYPHRWSEDLWNVDNLGIDHVWEVNPNDINLQHSNSAARISSFEHLIGVCPEFFMNEGVHLDYLCIVVDESFRASLIIDPSHKKGVLPDVNDREAWDPLRRAMRPLDASFTRMQMDLEITRQLGLTPGIAPEKYQEWAAAKQRSEQIEDDLAYGNGEEDAFLMGDGRRDEVHMRYAKLTKELKAASRLY